jgi:hypothetical protein
VLLAAAERLGGVVHQAASQRVEMVTLAGSQPARIEHLGRYSVPVFDLDPDAGRSPFLARHGAVPHVSRDERARPGVVVGALGARDRRRTALAQLPGAGAADQAAPFMAPDADPDVLDRVIGVLVTVE